MNKIVATTRWSHWRPVEVRLSLVKHYLLNESKIFQNSQEIFTYLSEKIRKWRIKLKKKKLRYLQWYIATGSPTPPRQLEATSFVHTRGTDWCGTWNRLPISAKYLISYLVEGTVDMKKKKWTWKTNSLIIISVNTQSAVPYYSAVLTGGLLGQCDHILNELVMNLHKDRSLELYLK